MIGCILSKGIIWLPKVLGSIVQAVAQVSLCVGGVTVRHDGGRRGRPSNWWSRAAFNSPVWIKTDKKRTTDVR